MGCTPGECPYCGSSDVVKAPVVDADDMVVYYGRCNNCGEYFAEDYKPKYQRSRCIHKDEMPYPSLQALLKPLNIKIEGSYPFEIKTKSDKEG